MRDAAPEYPDGYAGLHVQAQTYAYPALLAAQFGQVSNVTFTQHMTRDVGSGMRVLASLMPNHCGALDPIPAFDWKDAEPGWSLLPIAGTIIHNLGVPMLRLEDTDQDVVCQANPFFRRINTPGASQYEELVQAQDISFFTLWIGLEDMLAYGLRGGKGPVPADEDVFEAHLNRLILAATDSGRSQGIIGTLPDITRFPYFAAQMAWKPSPENCYVQKPLYIQDFTGEVRPALPGDRILLAARAFMEVDNRGLSPQSPIPDSLVLDQHEVLLIQRLTTAYNARIDSLVQRYNAAAPAPCLAIADLHSWFEEVYQGITEDGLQISGSYLIGGVFAADGLYLTPRGNALVANQFIGAINTFYPFRALINTLNPTDFDGVVFP